MKSSLFLFLTTFIYIYFIIYNLCRKFIEIEIFDDEDYEKKEMFSIELGKPIVDASSPGWLIYFSIQISQN